MFLLSGEMRSEFLATPELVRLCMPINKDGEPALLIKATTLTLKYLLHLRKFSLYVDYILPEGMILYAVKVDDDVNSPAVLWSIVETDNEKIALESLLNCGSCEVFLFNEGAINTNGARVRFEIKNRTSVSHALKVGPVKRRKYEECVVQCRKRLDAIYDEKYERAGTFQSESGIEWNSYQIDYVTNQNSVSRLDILNENEGKQQEILAVFFTDQLSISGATHGPIIHEDRGPREFTDILFGYEGGCFLIESKTLSIFERSTLPDRSKLKKNTLKNVNKAISQLKGTCRNLRSGLRITTSQGVEISLDKKWYPHCIILVPDLSLLHGSEDLGGQFIREFLEESEAYLHILDLVELLRSVQHAEIFAKNSKMGLPPIKCFDAALLMRWEYATKNPTPHFNFLFRMP